jgi:N-acetylglucosaminyldiphosphoundecaprenol N-acetyl-beta-D-mannosaminyltransferase
MSPEAAGTDGGCGSHGHIERLVLGGASVDLLAKATLLAQIEDTLSGTGKPLAIASANLDHVHHFGHRAAHADPAAATSTRWIVTADGMPIVWASRLLTHRSWPQLAGSDLLPDVLALAETHGAAVGFLGGWPEQHARLRLVLETRHPELAVSGYWSPEPAVLDDEAQSRSLAGEVASSGVDLLVVGLGKPRQERWLAEHLEGTGARVGLAFGASADFLAGSANRAPVSWRRFGLEWLYRLLLEPRRLWRRYLLQGPVAIWRLLRWSERPTS